MTFKNQKSIGVLGILVGAALLAFNNCSGFSSAVQSVDSADGQLANHSKFSATARKIWVHPNSQSGLTADWDTLFTHFGQWSETLAATNVYQLFDEAIAQYPAAQLTAMVKGFNANNVLVGVEAIGLSPSGCTGGASQGGAFSGAALLTQIQPIYDAGGEVNFISLDGSGIGFSTFDALRPDNNCKYSLNDAFTQLTIYMQTIHKVHPGIEFGIIANFPNYNYDGTSCYFTPNCPTFGGTDYVDILNTEVAVARAAGENFAFVHADNPYDYFQNHSGVPNVMARRLMILKAQVENLNMRFGLIINSDLGGQADNTDNLPEKSLQFKANSLDDLFLYSQAGGLTSMDLVIESWFHFPQFIMAETTANSFTDNANAVVYNYTQYLAQQGLSQPTPNPTLVPLASKVVGAIDAVNENGIGGWACYTHSSLPINVNVYVGNTEAAGGTLLVEWPANSANTTDESGPCQAVGTTYRFVIPWPTGSRAAYVGQPVFVYGVSPSGGSDTILNGSGTFVVPAAPAASAQAAAPVVAATPLPVAAPAPIAAPAPVAVAAPAPAPAPAPAMSTELIYRFVSPIGQHGYNTNPSAPIAGYALEGPVFSLYTAAYAGTTALYKCTQGNLHFMSIDPGCEGSTVESALGYVATTQLAGTVPLYRFRNNNWAYILESTNAAEGAGYLYADVLGYVP